jgi:hypothetical protein
MNVRTSSLIATIILGAFGLTTTVAMALDNTFPPPQGDQNTVTSKPNPQGGMYAGPPSPRLGRREVGAWLPLSVGVGNQGVKKRWEPRFRYYIAVAPPSPKTPAASSISPKSPPRPPPRRQSRHHDRRSADNYTDQRIPSPSQRPLKSP